ncbi:DinB family protein [Hufsiella ginkgonis]|uniref:DUF664 domain-containing protein n=1 Tax=Hufsiella ginkgonis TaxID=2695274 RepID=A0A7K1XV11_9SPHI|nr:DinB family protein [Hufsiella ginkgonis]MXV14822.1 DUF664 domain-containing protein [Hufsiella ginkgonis]
MNILPHLSRHLLEVSNGGNWTEVDLAATLQNLDYREASTVTAASPNTIAALVHHLTYWNRVMKQRLAGIDVLVPEINGFDVPAINNDRDWAALAADYFLSARELADAILQADEERLWDPIVPGRPSSVYKSLQGTVEHIHYHLGQLMILKKLIKS